MQIISYNLEDYSKIIFNGINYTIPETVKQIIHKLSTELGTSIHSTSDTADRDYNVKRAHPPNVIRRSKSVINKRVNADDESWEKIKPFQCTKIDKKEGLEKTVNDICACLNKISNKNYDIQRDAIFTLIRETITDDQDQTNLHKVSNAIFNLASTNKFYSDLYATLYKELIVEFPIFNNVVGGFIEQYLECVNQIEYVDQNTDYDKYCDNNKLNDKRKAMAAFIVNMMARDIIEKEHVFNILKQLEVKCTEYLNEPIKMYNIDEITENIYILVTMSNVLLKTNAGWTEIVDNIKKWSQYKSKEHKGLSSRAVFKYMDILDFINKNSK